MRRLEMALTQHLFVALLVSWSPRPCATLVPLAKPCDVGGSLQSRRRSRRTGFSVRPSRASFSDDNNDKSNDKGQRDEAETDPEEAERIAAFRAKLVSGGIEAVVRDDAPATKEPEMWARVAESPRAGRVLLGEESFFFGDTGPEDVVAKALKRVGLPNDVRDRVPDAERRRSLLPVVLLLHDGNGETDRDDDSGPTEGVLLGRRSGYILGDFKELDVAQFVIQPLWVGGPAPPPRPEWRTAGARSDYGETSKTNRGPTGILAVHPYAAVPNSRRLTDDGLCCGGDWAKCKEFVELGRANPFRFRLYAMATTWDTRADLDRELQAGAWRVADVATDLILKDRDRGAQVWADIDQALAQGKGA